MGLAGQGSGLSPDIMVSAGSPGRIPRPQASVSMRHKEEWGTPEEVA